MHIMKKLLIYNVCLLFCNSAFCLPEKVSPALLALGAEGHATERIDALRKSDNPDEQRISDYEQIRIKKSEECFALLEEIKRARNAETDSEDEKIAALHHIQRYRPSSKCAQAFAEEIERKSQKLQPVMNSDNEDASFLNARA